MSMKIFNLIASFVLISILGTHRTLSSSQHDKATDLSSGNLSGTSSIIPPIFVMNLDRATDRWEKVSLEMSKAGLSVQKFAAVDGRKLSEEELVRDTTYMSRCLQPRGVIGCYLSHRKFWNMIVKENISQAIIFEDDIQLIPDFKTKLIDCLQSVETHKLNTDKQFSYDVILLGAIGRVHEEGKDHIIARLFSWYYGGLRRNERITDHLFVPVKPAGTHGYLVSQAGAQKLLALCPKAVHHVDLDAWRHSSLRIFMFSPTLVYQTFDHTSLTDPSQSTPFLSTQQICEMHEDGPDLESSAQTLYEVFQCGDEKSAGSEIAAPDGQHLATKETTEGEVESSYVSTLSLVSIPSETDIPPSTAVITSQSAVPMLSLRSWSASLRQLPTLPREQLQCMRRVATHTVHATKHAICVKSMECLQIVRSRVQEIQQFAVVQSLAKKLRNYTQEWVEDPLTHQPLQHVLAEPILQLGPGGPVLTVGRYLSVFSSGVALFLALQVLGYSWPARLAFYGVTGFAVSVRSIIWLLMNWK